MILLTLIDRVVTLLWVLIFVRAILSWIPSVDYGHPLIRLIMRVTDPILVPVRRLLPPLNGLDLSPWIAILAIQFAGRLLHTIVLRILVGG